MERIMVFIPMYNCEKQVVRVLKQFDTEMNKYISEIVVVNNRSTDDGEKKVLEFIRKNEISIPITLLRNKENYGLGGSHKVAFNYAIENKYDYLIVLHGDDQGNIHDILDTLKNKEYEKYDCILGARFAKGSKLIGYSKFRIFGNRIFNIIFSMSVRRKVLDLGSGLNMYNVSILKDKFYMKFPDNLTFNCCMLFASNYYKHSIRFVPISWREEDQVSNVKMFSQAKMTLKMALKYFFNKNYIKSEFREKIIDSYEASEVKEK